MNIHTEITINATPDQVWKHLIAFESYHEWNPFIAYNKGEISNGNQIDIEVDGMKFKPTLLAVNENQKLEWKGRLLFPGVFDGTHTFELEDNGDGTSTLIQREQFKGILVPLFKKKLQTDTVKGFESMNEALKKRCELN